MAAKAGLILMFTCHIALICTEKCSNSYGWKARDKLRCVTKNGNFKILTSIPRNTCTLECMRRQDCSLINYNNINNTCLMTNEACTELLEDSDYQVQHFGKMGDWCIYWAPYPDHDIRLLPSDDECVLPARYMYSSHIIPGRLALGDDALYTIFEGNRLNTYDTIGQEVLQVHPQCHAIWMRYTVGDVIPMGAVIGGYIAGVGGYDLYIIKVPPHNGYDQFGYFDPKLNQGIVDLYGMQTYTEMEMLVLI